MNSQFIIESAEYVLLLLYRNADNSPKKSPGNNFYTQIPPTDIITYPATIIYILNPLSPSRKIGVYGAKISLLYLLKFKVRSSRNFGEQLEKTGVLSKMGLY